MNMRLSSNTSNIQREIKTNSQSVSTRLSIQSIKRQDYKTLFQRRRMQPFKMSSKSKIYNSTRYQQLLISTQSNQVLEQGYSLGAITSSFQEVDQAKSSLIAELQQQLSQIRKAHSHMVKAYEGKLAEFVIPVEELGFDPLVPTNTE